MNWQRLSVATVLFDFPATMVPRLRLLIFLYAVFEQGQAHRSVAALS
jgi:hypothetical protein